MMSTIKQLVSRWRWLALALLAATLPFELRTPIVSFDPIAITDVEIILYAVIAVWLFDVLRARRVRWTLAHSAVLAWLIIQFTAAIFAPIERDAALKFALRSTGGAAVFLIAADWIRSGRGAAWIMSAIALGAVLSAVIGILEAQFTSVQSALLIFKTQATLVGGQVRASGTFQYANTAAMYWEAALPIIFAAGVWYSLERLKRRWLAIALVAGFIVIEAIILSASRAALVSIAIVLGVLIIADRIRSTRSGVGRPAAIGLIALIVLCGFQLFVNPFFATRLISESDDTWFRAVIQPAQTDEIASAGEVFTTTVVVTNTSVRTWPSAGVRPVYLSYHWIQPDSGRVLILDGERTSLPHDLAPGEATTVTALVKVPPVTGALLLQWDLVQEDVTWFSERGSAVADVPVRVIPAPAHQLATFVPESVQLSDTSSPPRAELWRAGVEMGLSHPLLGIGPDNFRHVYGQYLGQTAFDDRITANNWYIELFATTGIVGLMSWLLIPIALIAVARRQWPRLMQHDRILVVGLGAALLAFFLHGMVDYFMEFTPTYGLFWLIAGLLVGLLTGTRDVEVSGTTDRV
jgi:hypothetical protein